MSKPRLRILQVAACTGPHPIRFLETMFECAVISVPAYIVPVENLDKLHDSPIFGTQVHQPSIASHRLQRCIVAMHEYPFSWRIEGAILMKTPRQQGLGACL